MKDQRKDEENGKLERLGALGRGINVDDQEFENILVYPGLTPGAREIANLAIELPKRFAILSYKHQMPCLWAAFLGGTGTGKSTLFNALCGEPLSETGVERPKTGGPIAYAYRGAAIEEAFPIASIRMEREPSGDSWSGPAAGAPGRLLILEHNREELSHLILVDTPDLDSVEAENRQIAEDLYLLSDAVVFVTSQEKYADEVPSQFFRRVLSDEKLYFFLLNKVQEDLTNQELLGPFLSQDISFSPDRIWPISYEASNVFQRISEQSPFLDFSHCLSRELSSKERGNLRKIQLNRRAKDLKGQIDRLLELLEQESRASENWLRQLDAFFETISDDLIKDEKERFTSQSREYLRTEVRRLFNRYDVLAKPRRLVREFLLSPFRLLGFRRQSTEENHREVLLKVREKTDLAPVYRAIETFNRMVLEKLSPQDESSPLFEKLRQPGIALSDDEIRDWVWKENDRLAEWLEETFQRLAKGIPKSKQLGIYSTSILWGILMLSLETAVGGGFTVLDAALDSALAPFVTKGAVELFAYNEIQKIARELAERYQAGLLSALHQQRDRYKRCLSPLMPTRETLESLRGLHPKIDSFKT